MLKKLIRNRKGQGLVEYALIIAGVALIAAAAISVFGHKVTDLISATAVILPGAHPDDNAAIQSGHLIETGPTGTNGAIAVDAAAVTAANSQSRLFDNVMGANSEAAQNPDSLIQESTP
jgi:pilus assembly protein Flp/PilA